MRTILRLLGLFLVVGQALAAAAIIEFDTVSESGGPATPATITHAATPSNGELLLAFVQNEWGDDGTIVVPSGFSLLESQLGHTSGSAGSPSLRVYTKTAASEAGNTYVWESSNGRIIIQQYRISGAGTPTSLGKNTSGAGTATTLDIANGSQSAPAGIAIACVSLQDGDTADWTTGGFTVETNFRGDMWLATRSYPSGGTAQPIPTWASAWRARSILVSVPDAATGGLLLRRRRN